jgi:hypothetical protein
VVALVDDKCVPRYRFRVEFVGVEKVHKFGFCH